MAEAIRGLFTSSPGLNRVNILGLIVILVALLLEIFAGKLAGYFPEEKREGAKIAFKLVGLLLTAAGVAIAILL